jgi:uncharacterized oligopeptide transporter (OPT) family protein
MLKNGDGKNFTDSNTSHLSDPEIHWYKNVYQGDSQPQLTFRAVIMGSILGGFMALSNLYVGLKTGWGLGVAITACILSFAIYKSLMTVFPFFFKTEMTLLENNCMQSTASSAGYSTGTAMVAGVPAYLMITGHQIPWGVLGWWTFFLAALGVFMAIPMKRQMVNVEQLKFPSGIAAAETLRSLHSQGEEASAKAKALGIAGLFGALIAWFRDAAIPKFLAIPDMLGFPGAIDGIPMIKWTLSFEMSSIMIAAGAIMGFNLLFHAFGRDYQLRTFGASDGETWCDRRNEGRLSCDRELEYLDRWRDDGDFRSSSVRLPMEIDRARVRRDDRHVQ